MKHALELNEGERQMVLMALAHLSVERPGWDDVLHVLALQIDSQRDGRPQVYDEFRSLRRRALANERNEKVDAEPKLDADRNKRGFPKGFVLLKGPDAKGGVRCYYCGARYWPDETEEELATRRREVGELGLADGFGCDDCENGLPKLRDYWLAQREPLCPCGSGKTVDVCGGQIFPHRVDASE